MWSVRFTKRVCTNEKRVLLDVVGVELASNQSALLFPLSSDFVSV